MRVKIMMEEGAIMPRKATEGSAGYDLCVPYDVKVEKGRQVIPLGLRLQLPMGYMAEIRPRSGFSAKGMEGVGSYPGGRLKTRFDCDCILGTVDSDYRGTIGVIVNNRDTEFVIKRGTRIAQMVIVQHEDVKFERSGILEDTQRGDGGFGHTGA